MLVGEVEKTFTRFGWHKVDGNPTFYGFGFEGFLLSLDAGGHALHDAVGHGEDVGVNLLEEVFVVTSEDFVGVEVDVSAAGEWGNVDVAFNLELVDDPDNVGDGVVLVCAGEMRRSALNDCLVRK